jgi:transposase-like protein
MNYKRTDMTVYVEGDYGQRKAAVLVLRNAGLTQVCPYCHQGVIERKGVIRDQCKICKRKVVRLPLGP